MDKHQRCERNFYEKRKLMVAADRKSRGERKRKNTGQRSAASPWNAGFAAQQRARKISQAGCKCESTESVVR